MSKQLQVTWLDQRFNSPVRLLPKQHNVVLEEISNDTWVIKLNDVLLKQLSYPDLFKLCTDTRGNRTLLTELLIDQGQSTGYQNSINPVASLDAIEGVRVAFNAALVADSEILYPNEFQADQWFDDNFLLDMNPDNRHQEDVYFLPTQYSIDNKLSIDNLYAAGLLGKFTKIINDRTQQSYFLWFDKQMYHIVLSADFLKSVALYGFASFTIADIDVLKEAFRLRDKRIDKFVRSAW